MFSSTKSFSILLCVFFFLFPSGTGLYSRTLTITNNCTYTVWPAVLSGVGSLPLPTTGFALLPGDSNTLRVPLAWSGRLWGRTLCSIDITGKFSCVTGGCGTSTIECAGTNPAPPVTLVEFDFDGTSKMNLYDISLVEGFNLPVRVAPTGGKCLATSCLADLNACPTELKVIRNEEAVACKNTCETEACLSSLFFKNACSDAHVYAHDYGFFTCSSPHYTVTFCPTSKSGRKAEKKKEASRKNVVKYTGVLAFISVICGLILFRIRLRLSNRDCEISLSAGARADTTIAPNA